MNRSQASHPDAFGFDEPDEQWLERLRRVRHTPVIGPLGDYEIIEQISRGGQGLVYKARQPRTNRVVALKRVLGGVLASPDMRARFEREMRVEVALDHPNIVRVFGMELIDGQPLLVMQWIDGLPVDRWTRHSEPSRDRERAVKETPASDTRPESAPRRSVRDILALFLKIADAVHHAHQRGVIHRDLKPSNILVDAAGEPHVLDFGLARLVDEDDSAAAARLTTTHGFLGTLAYAAPEQVRGEHVAVDVRTDEYALGVILYEMLTGRLPYADIPDADGANLAALLDAIRQLDPLPPSRAVPLGPSVPRSLRPFPFLPSWLRASVPSGNDPDLDAMVLKTLAKEPDRRYPSVDALAADIRRYLSGEPIEAKRDSAWYVLRKTLRRHRAAVGVAAAFVVLLACGAAVSTVLWQRAERESQIARDEADKAEQISGFLEGMLASLSPERVEGHDITLLLEVLDEAAGRVEAEFANRPDVRATLHTTIGKTYEKLGQFAPAERHLRKALEIRRELFPGDHPDVASSLYELARLLEFQRLPFDQEVRALIDESLAMRRTLFGDDHPATADSLYLWARASGLDWESNIDIFRQVLAVRRRWLGNAHPTVAHTLHVIGNCLAALDRYEEAETYYRESLEIRRRVLPDNHPLIISGAADLAGHLAFVGKLDEAVPLADEALERARRYFPPEHRLVGSTLLDRGYVMLHEDRAADAEPLLREALHIYEKCYQEGHWRIAVAQSELGEALAKLGRYEEAEPLLLNAFAVLESTFKIYPASHFHVRIAAQHLAELYEAWDAVEPGTGFAEKATRFRAALDQTAQVGAGP